VHLKQQGSSAWFRQDDAGGLRPDMQMRGVDLLVRADDAKRAEAILAS